MEYVFNESSNKSLGCNHDYGLQLITSLLQTLAELDVQLPGELRLLRFPRHPWQLVCAEDGSTFGDLLEELRESRTTRTLADYFDALQIYAPADYGLSDSQVEAILRLLPTSACEGYEGCYESICDAGLDAAHCVLQNAILVSFDLETLDFFFAKFYCGEDEYRLEHASKPYHAKSIVLQRQNDAQTELKKRKSIDVMLHRAFPNLSFGLDVAQQLREFSTLYYDLAIKKLAKIDNSVSRWQAGKVTSIADDGVEITGESKITMENYGDQRKFRSSNGAMQTFEDHIWIDKGNRIHLMVDSLNKSIEIGYIGKHLKTWKFG